MLKLLFIAITAATAATAAAAAKAAIFSKKSAQDNYVNTTVSERIYESSANVPANVYLPSEYDDESDCMYI
jgi:ABC-type sugar transport system substrate-binding protein